MFGNIGGLLAEFLSAFIAALLGGDLAGVIDAIRTLLEALLGT